MRRLAKVGKRPRDATVSLTYVSKSSDKWSFASSSQISSGKRWTQSATRHRHTTHSSSDRKSTPTLLTVDGVARRRLGVSRRTRLDGCRRMRSLDASKPRPPGNSCSCCVEWKVARRPSTRASLNPACRRKRPKIGCWGRRAAPSTLPRPTPKSATSPSCRSPPRQQERHHTVAPASLTADRRGGRRLHPAKAPGPRSIERPGAAVLLLSLVSAPRPGKCREGPRAERYGPVAPARQRTCPKASARVWRSDLRLDPCASFQQPPPSRSRRIQEAFGGQDAFTDDSHIGHRQRRWSEQRPETGREPSRRCSADVQGRKDGGVVGRLCPDVIEYLLELQRRDGQNGKGEAMQIV
eukprot:scaffold2277_cov256-Pinguiococcus_pyrenoidosus.AAC.17